ncbi:MAG: aspartate--tRNA(Asn) ligase [Lachnospiraceae bacterium]|nr:aspartate--tRNA(Asn) ligase [Lachnospiraceae bacterium]
MKMITGIKETKYVNAEELGKYIGGEVHVKASIYKIRRMKGFAFVLLRTSRMVVQSIYSAEEASFPLETLKEECCCNIRARVVLEERSRTGYELHLLDVEVLTEPEEISPIVINGKQMNTSMEKLLDYRPITLRNDKERAIFKIQNGITDGMRSFFAKEGFTEIHSPKIVFAGAEGGANIFKLDYFGKEAYLAQSPQFYKQMMVGVYERVFEIGPVFRAEKHDTSRHLNEYTGVDFEMGYIETFEEIMQMETEMLKAVMEWLRKHCAYELELLSATLPEIEEIPAIRFSEAKEWIARECNRPIRDYEDFEPEEEKLLSELVMKKFESEFVFVTHYPSKKRPFYAMDDSENPEDTLSFDLLFRGLEITTGGQRIHGYRQQMEKIIARGMDPDAFESYLMMHKHGIPPHGGMGMGLERLTSRLLMQDNVRYSTLFPRDVHRLTP